MTTLIQICYAFVVLLPPIGGIAAGFCLPWRLLAQRPGYRWGPIIGFPMILLLSVEGATLGGGYGEDYLGMTWGVPFGLAIGGLVTSTVLNLLTGAIGMVLCSIFHADSSAILNCRSYMHAGESR